MQAADSDAEVVALDDGELNDEPDASDDALAVAVDVRLGVAVLVGVREGGAVPELDALRLPLPVPVLDNVEEALAVGVPIDETDAADDALPVDVDEREADADPVDVSDGGAD